MSSESQSWRGGQRSGQASSLMVPWAGKLDSTARALCQAGGGPVRSLPRRVSVSNRKAALPPRPNLCRSMGLVYVPPGYEIVPAATRARQRPSSAAASARPKPRGPGSFMAPARPRNRTLPQRPASAHLQQRRTQAPDAAAASPIQNIDENFDQTTTMRSLRKINKLDLGGTWTTTHDLYFTNHVGKHPNLIKPEGGTRTRKSKLDIEEERLAMTPRDLRKELHNNTLYSNVFFTTPVRDGYCLPEGNGLQATEKPPPRRPGDNRPPWRRITNAVPESAPVGVAYYPRRRQPTLN